MLVYNVKEGSVSVRRIASSSSNVINIIPQGGKIYVVGEEAGWLRTVSGYYVFKSSNLELDNPLQTTVQNSPKRNVLLAATTDSTNLKPGQYVVLDTGQTGYQTQAKTAEQIQAEQESKISQADKVVSDDVVRNEYDQDKALTIKFNSKDLKTKKIVKWNADGTPATDEEGNYVLVDAPDIVSDENAKNAIIQIVSNNNRKYAIFQDKNGNQWLSPMEESSIGDYANPKVENTNGEFSDLNQAEKEARERESETILEQIGRLGSRLISTYFYSIDMQIEDARTVFGMPYQFMPIVDPRTVKGEEISAFSHFGRKFQEKIIARAPILYIQAGLPLFMRGYSDKDRTSMFEALTGKIENLEKETLNKIIDNQDSQYYAFQEDSNSYFKAVNSACTALAHFLQIEKVQIPSIPIAQTISDASETAGEVIDNALNPKALGNINWALRTNHSLGWYRGAVAFYINSETQIQESFSNTTRQSELAGKINQLSDRAMEAAFLLGGVAGALDDRGYSNLSSLANFQQEWNRETGHGDNAPGMLGSIGQNIQTFIAGGKMIFPEIWHDSQFGRSYNVTIKLDSPDSDNVSIFLNVLVPLAHILGFVLPRYAGNNMYVNPYLVRCFYKSMFHIDMGIITSCQVTRGDSGSWNSDGLPCHVNVELTIKDMYSQLAQSSGSGNTTIISNAAQLEYLASLAGVHVPFSSYTRLFELWYALNGVNRIKQNLVGSFTNMAQSLFRVISNAYRVDRYHT